MRPPWHHQLLCLPLLYLVFGPNKLTEWFRDDKCLPGSPHCLYDLVHGHTSVSRDNWDNILNKVCIYSGSHYCGTSYSLDMSAETVWDAFFLHGLLLDSLDIK